ncbi:MAG: hypothetical protein ACK41D_10585 [Rubricoccaceae bacterium]
MSDSRHDTYVSAEGLIEVAREAHAPTARRADAHGRFVADHWPELAAAAYEGYLRHGAGAVVLWRDAAPGRLRPRPFAPERLWYATQVHNLPGAGPDAFDGWAARQLERYDPREAAVVVFIEGKQLAGYHVAGPPGPPEAHRRAAASLN